MPKQDLLFLFDRPYESMCMPKGLQGVHFNVPSEYLTDKVVIPRPKPANLTNGNLIPTVEVQKMKLPPLANLTNGNLIPTVEVQKMKLPPLGDIEELAKDDDFSLFIPRHKRLAGKLIDMFLEMKDADCLMSMAVYARERVNPLLFHYAYSVALLHRPDTKEIGPPSVLFAFPDKYFDKNLLRRARQFDTNMPVEDRTPIELEVDYNTASDVEQEHRLAYFREDIGLNLHHWHWHEVYPTEGSLSVMNKDRRGELFYYMHQQVMARYNFERLSNGMNRKGRFTDFNEPIPEAYFPKLDKLVASRNWPARVANMRWQNLNRDVDQLHVNIDDMNRWRDRIFEAIHSGFVRNKNQEKIPLTESEGIDILGNIIEATDLSINKEYYGDFHNMGHNFTGLIHDPDHRHLESFGVMGDSATSMRDPFFYRWHAYIDDIFQIHKSKLPRYTEQQLSFPNVTIKDIHIKAKNAPIDTFQTFWQKSDVDLSRGMDFDSKGPILIRFTHLQHKQFSYSITVDNASKDAVAGTCRIFMAPKFDERSKPWSFANQKGLFIELDKFTVKLKSGRNTILRASSESSVTIPFEKTFRNLVVNRPPAEDVDALDSFNFCGCGWPHHMLIPKGHEHFKAQLFVMISDYNGDRVDQDTTGVCNDAGSYCGIRDRKYPDKRSMGFPFDRQPRNGVGTLQEFLTPNMKVQDVEIQYNNITFEPGQEISI